MEDKNLKEIDVEKQEQTKNKLGAKVFSKIAMVIGTIWITVTGTLKGVGLFEMSAWEIMLIGLTIAYSWSPTYISMWIDKIKGIKD